MVDFKKLRKKKGKSAVIDPIEIFRRQPKPPEITDLYTSQAHVLEEWHRRRTESDIVIKLHTGGGKTLVGLLIAQSILNEISEPVIYLCPTVQLAEQTLKKAEEYGIAADIYTKSTPFPDAFLAGKSVFICTYNALFNGLGKFGAPGRSHTPIHAGAIILDDAHVSFKTIRDSYTLKVDKEKSEEAYQTLSSIFRNDFKEIGKLGTFDSIVSGEDHNVLEVPYWSWQAKSNQVSEFLRTQTDEYKFVWPFLRDSFDYCHVLISNKNFIITPFLPLVDLIPTFSSATKRIYMSATIGDDSAIVRTFNAKYDSISKPIFSKSLAGISERMILAPELMSLKEENIQEMLIKVANWATEKLKKSTVILVPSSYAAGEWKDVAIYASNTIEVAERVKDLQEYKTFGPVIFANRYDGIDLPGDSCRLLIMSGLPKGTSEYEIFKSNVFLDGASINSSISQRIEQGIGRAARGPGDYCVVIITGKDLISWVSRSSNLKFLTSSTRAQLEIGLEVSKDVSNTTEFAETIRSCLDRNKDWIEYHAETLAESVKVEELNFEALTIGDIEQKALRLWRDGYFDKAIGILEKFCETHKTIDKESRAWLLQLAARISHYWGNTDKSLQLQQYAFSLNRYLTRPKVVPPYTAITPPSQQAENIVARVSSYHPKRGFLAKFEETVSKLVPESSANQFENSLETLGKMLGFSCERPEKIYGVGPDIIWLLNNEHGLVIEAKSRKYAENAFTKEQHGQLLVSLKWFKKEYPNYTPIGVSIHPNISATKNAIADDTKALTLEKLNEIISNSRLLFTTLCESSNTQIELINMATIQLKEHKLIESEISNQYLVEFKLDSKKTS